MKNMLQIIKDSWFLAKPFWTSEKRNYALFLLLSTIACGFIQVYIAVIFNKWNNDFYNTLQNYNYSAFKHYLVIFAYIASAAIVLVFIKYYVQKKLEISWRKWMFENYITKLLTNQAYYKNRFLNYKVDNYDQRISDDVNSFIVLLLSLGLGFISSVTTFISFAFILYGLSNVISWQIHNTIFHLHGYLLWVAILYSGVATYITFKISKPLAKLDYDEQAYEANIRYNIIRTRENAEHIAFYRGESQEKSSLFYKFDQVVTNFLSIIKVQIKVSIFQTLYSQVSNVFPILVLAPRYFAKKIELGGLMQIAGAFGKVQEATDYFLNAYNSFAGYRATMNRLLEFNQMVADSNKLITQDITHHEQSILSIRHLNISTPKGKEIIHDFNYELFSSDHLLIMGASGTGKTTLLRTIAGLWSFSTGEILQDKTKTTMFISQKPYMPLGTLREVICYPLQSDFPSDDKLISIMCECHLAHLTSELDSIANFGEELSIGEQQRIAFVRILINNPDILFLDESTSAIDEELEAILYKAIINHNPQIVIISIGHRSSLKQLHNKFIKI